jgi:hypothetical protein
MAIHQLHPLRRETPGVQTAPSDPRTGLARGQVGYAEPVRYRCVGGMAGYVTTTVTPASRYVGGLAGYVTTTVTPASRYVGGLAGYVTVQAPDRYAAVAVARAVVSDPLSRQAPAADAAAGDARSRADAHRTSAA